MKKPPSEGIRQGGGRRADGLSPGPIKPLPPAGNQGLISDSLSFGTGDRISLPDDIANGNMIENAPYCIAPDNRDSREPQCHFSRFSQSDLDTEKREDHRLGANGDDVAHGHVDEGFDKAVTARLAGHALHISSSQEGGLSKSTSIAR